MTASNAVRIAHPIVVDSEKAVHMLKRIPLMGNVTHPDASKWTPADAISLQSRSLQSTTTSIAGRRPVFPIRYLKDCQLNGSHVFVLCKF